MSDTADLLNALAEVRRIREMVRNHEPIEAMFPEQVQAFVLCDLLTQALREILENGSLRI